LARLSGEVEGTVQALVELRCNEFVEMIPEYLEAALPPKELRRVERHLKRCDGCDAYLRQMRETIRLIGALREQPELTAAETLLRASGRWEASPNASPL
jgi:anti-sigma factor RsiW